MVVARALLLLLVLQLVRPQCTHKVFCSPPILEAIAKANIFPDSKSFVDLVLKVPVETALSNFLAYNVSEFVRLSFHDDPSIILEPTSFDDFQEKPPLLERIKDGNLREFAGELHQRWNQLGRKVVLERAAEVGSCRSQCSSMIEDVNGQKILVPGGRFRESYYWDTYWIVLGLIASDMLETAEGVLDTFALVLKHYGFIPNGLRQYYLNRSQPPFLFLMLKKLAEAHSKKGNPQRADQLERKFFFLLRTEHEYWENTHAATVEIRGTKHKVNQYRAATTLPRPESYREDTATVASITDPQHKSRVLACLSTMAESGWDFSSRWLEQADKLQSVVIDKLVPSDLNALLGLQESYMATLSSRYGYEDLVEFFVDRLIQRRKYFAEVKRGSRYPDYRIDDPAWTAGLVFPTDFLPALLFSETPFLREYFGDLVNPAASKARTGQQWDSPNVWAPNNWILHEVGAFEEAAGYAQEWIKTTYCGWRRTGNLFEKYRNDAYGERGEGGEYVVQTGFGWTNGLVLHYLSLYGQTYSVGQC